MTYLRILALALFLSGCDETAAPSRPAPLPAEPVLPPASQEQIREAPPAPPSKPLAAPRQQPRVARPAPAAVPPVLSAPEAPPLKPLDLSLPADLLEAVEPGEPLRLEPVLPSLFGHEIVRDYRLNGRLIESPDEERLFEGAELRLEIRR